MVTKRSGRKKVGKVMGEYKRGSLKSSSGRTVKKREQAVAIALSEARRSGADVPPKGGRKRAAANKRSARKKRASGRSR